MRPMGFSLSSLVAMKVVPCVSAWVTGIELHQQAVAQDAWNPPKKKTLDLLLMEELLHHLAYLAYIYTYKTL